MESSKKSQLVLTIALSFVCMSMSAQSQAGTATITFQEQKAETTISRHIYGHFSEHLGHCIYDGLWVGKDSEIPNIDGVRKDVFDALKQIRIPNLRWPGGCFADEYHWMDGIGQKRAKMVNTNWGYATEDNSFGTHEFLNMCEQLGTEPYVCGNVGSGTVEEMSKWVEYMNSPNESPMTELRKQNGRENPWKVTFFAVGNESYGCGGNFTAEDYATAYRRYQTFCRNYNGGYLKKVASGPSVPDDYHWTETIMSRIPLPQVNASASVNADGRMHLTIANLSPDRECQISCPISPDYKRISQSQLLTAKNIADHNTFETPNNVHLSTFDKVVLKKGALTFKMPAKSVVMIELE